MQTFRAEHPVFNMLLCPGGEDIRRLMDERREFGYPPFTRLIRILLRSREQDRLETMAQNVSAVLDRSGFRDVGGPAAPPQEKAGGEYQLQFLVKTDRAHSWAQAKERLYRELRRIPSTDLTIDVDPVS